MSNIPKLSFRKLSEILAIEVDETGYFLKNGLFTRGNAFTIVGPSEAGKSRLLLQLAACIITGRDFLGMEVNAQPDMKWLIVQTENHHGRLVNDANNLRKWLGKDWQLVDNNLLLHVLEHEHDYITDITEKATQSMLGNAILNYKPGVVVFDPLVDFAWGNLITDKGMRDTCQTLAQFARAGNPDACPVLLHHSLTGKAGIRKATGFDRASFARGSKALHGWTRGQLNIAPVKPDDSSELIIDCGKTSNGKRFEPFGVILNPDSMIYEVNPDFSLEVWEDSLSRSTKGEPMVNIASVVELLGTLGLTKAKLAAFIMAEHGTSRSRSYEVIAQAEKANAITFDGKLLRVKTVASPK